MLLSIRRRLLLVTVMALGGWGGSLWAGSVLPSAGLSFHRWGHENGLPDDSVTALLQTQDGYLWIGTARGLARFDGVDFDAVALPGGGSNRTVAVTSLCEDDAHRLWIGAQESGLFWLEDGVIHRFAGGGSGSITSLANDGRGQLWVGGSAGLFRVSLAGPVQGGVGARVFNELISSVHAARSGTIWVTTRTGMSQYKNGRFTPVEFSAENEGPNPEFMGLYEDSAGNLWALATLTWSI